MPSCNAQTAPLVRRTQSYWLFTSKTLLLTTAIAGLASSAGGQSTTALTTQDCPVCTTFQRMLWSAIESMTDGITGKDVTGHVIGHTSDANFKFVPMSTTKETLCGTLYNFDYENDHDWSWNVLPSHPFAGMLAAAVAAGSSYPKCDSQHCVHAEVNMDQSFPRDDFFKVDYNSATPGDSPATTDLIGESICLYGVWLKDVNHDKKPEIHPAELIWWKDKQRPRSIKQPLWAIERGLFHVVLLQDDSNRFDRRSDFGTLGTILPDFSRPWSAVPRRVELAVYFRADLRRDKLTSYAISERYSRNVVTASDATARHDQGAGTEHTITFDGEPVLRVSELQPDDNLGVTFDTLSLCRDPRTNSLLGRIVLNTKFGVDDRGEEGYQVLDIVRSDIDLRLQGLLQDARNRTRLQALALATDSVRSLIAQFRPTRQPRLPPRPRFVFTGPVRRVGSSLVSGIGVEVETTSAAGAVRIRAARHHTRSGSADLGLVPVGNTGGQSQALVRDVPVLQGGSVAVELEDGTRHRMPVPTLGIAALRQIEAPTHVRPAPAAWRMFALAAGASGNRVPARADLMRADTWSVEMFPRYAPREDEGVAGEEETHVTRSLNAVLDSASTYSSPGGAGRSRVADLFGSPRPFSVRWNFSATDLTTKKAVPVMVGRKGSPGEIEVDTTGSSPGTLRIGVTFPASGSGIYRLDAVGTVSDANGITGDLRHSVWSHYLNLATDATGTSLLETVAEMAGADSDAFVGAASMKPTASDMSPASARRSYAQVARASAIEAGRDGRVTVAEFQRLLRLAEGFRQSKHEAR